MNFPAGQSLICSFNVYFVSFKQLQPCRSKYREGEEYCILRHIQNGSYGDVFCVRDKGTGFECAAKRVSQETLTHSFNFHALVDRGFCRALETTMKLQIKQKMEIRALTMLSSQLRFH